MVVPFLSEMASTMLNTSIISSFLQLVFQVVPFLSKMASTMLNTSVISSFLQLVFSSHAFIVQNRIYTAIIYYFSLYFDLGKVHFSTIVLTFVQYLTCDRVV